MMFCNKTNKNKKDFFLAFPSTPQSTRERAEPNQPPHPFCSCFPQDAFEERSYHDLCRVLAEAERWMREQART